MGTFRIGQRIEMRDVYSNIDSLYGPYTSTEEAHRALLGRQQLGTTVGIIKDEGVVEYWYKAGTEFKDLVVKIANNIPKLEYVTPAEGEPIRVDTNKEVIIQVKFTSSFGDTCTIKVRKNGADFKVIKTTKGVIGINLGKQTVEGTNTYEVTGMDAMTTEAEGVLSYRVIVGGAKVSSNLQQLIDDGLNTSTSITLTYNASVADTTKTVKFYGRVLLNGEPAVADKTDEGSGASPNVLASRTWEIGTLSEPGSYVVVMYAYTGEDYEHPTGDDVSKSITYSFELMDAGAFKMSSPIDSIPAGTTTNDTVIVPFRIYSGTRDRNLVAKGQVKNSSDVVIKEFSREVTGNILYSWSVGKLSPAGDYTIVLWAQDPGSQVVPPGTVYVYIPANISEYTPEYRVVEDGLISAFEAAGKSNHSDADTKGYWLPSPSSSQAYDDTVYFKLTDLNYNTNGWKHVDESLPDTDPSGEMMLRFTGDSFGLLKKRDGITPADSDQNYNPISVIADQGSEAKGFTAEIIYRTRCVGELKNKVITGHANYLDSGAGFSANYERITVGADGQQVYLDASEDEWHHVAMVIDLTTHTDDSTYAQDYAPAKLMTLYINGSMCGATIIENNASFSSYGPVLLNAAIDHLAQKVSFFGSCEIKTIRFYNRPLLAHEVEQNYIASIYDPEEQSRIAGRNDKALPSVHFVYNSDNARLGNNTTFDDLNNLTRKELQKTTFVYAKVVYKDKDNNDVPDTFQEATWPYVQIQTQGTSTLAFPVKNYKIRLYNSNNYNKKYKTSLFASEGWQDENTYTLKCDYMEAAHLNNTPSASFYNDMIDALVDGGTIQTGWSGGSYTASNDQRSPARRGTGEGTAAEVHYFDAIKGFPCLVYYYNSNEDYIAGNGHYLGSYMFNLDKSANSLGFDVPAVLDSSGDTEQIENPRYTEGGEEEQYVDNICQSFEGVANGSDTAGCFYSYAAWKDSYYATYVNKAYSEFLSEYPFYDGTVSYSEGDKCTQYKEIDGVDVLYTFTANTATTGDWDSSDWDEFIKCSVDDFSDYYLENSDTPYKSDTIPVYNENSTYMQGDKVSHTDAGVAWIYKALENNITGAWVSSKWEKEEFDDNGYLFTKENYLTAASPYSSEYDYFASDFEIRYDWDDLEEGGAEFWGTSSWGLKRMVDWVSNNSANAGKSGNEDTFKSGFSDYFNYTYCALYYLQMIVFGQVDNAGKNSMWDTWDGVHWYPRPYDLDTMAGLNNTGHENVNPDAELNILLSPYRAEGGSYARNTSPMANYRYTSYNTRDSKFWIAFARSYKGEIDQLYASLRNAGVYSMDHIMEYYKALTSDIIGETYYNTDMVTKFYKLSNINTFIDRMHGNRIQRFRAWMSKRLVFCDSLFNYGVADKSQNSNITLRVDPNVREVKIGIRVYSPQYIHISVGSGYDANIETYCSPDSTYTDANGNTFEGAQFTLSIPAGNKEVLIAGAGNIRDISNLAALGPSSLGLSNATRIVSLDLTSSLKLITLSLSNNKYLRHLDCSGSINLGTDPSGDSLNLSACENLQEVNLDNTKLRSVSIAEGGALKTISAKNTLLTSLYLKSLQFLTSVSVDGCSNINSYSVSDCPKLLTIVADSLPLTTVDIQDCAGLQNLSLQSDHLITSMTLLRCPSLSSINYSGSLSPAFATLDFSSIYTLASLDISGCETVEKIKFPVKTSASSDVPWGQYFTYFNAARSGLTSIQYGESTKNYVDMSQLTGLTTLSFESALAVTTIKNISYTGGCRSMFRGCSYLTTIEGTINATDCYYMFYSCPALKTVTNLTINLTSCTNLTRMFSRAPYVKYSEIKRFLDTLPNSGSSNIVMDNICYDRSFGVTYTAQDADCTIIPANFFGNCKKVRSLSGAFVRAGLTGVNNNAFVDSEGNNGLQSCIFARSMFYGNTKLTSVPSDILSYFPSVTDVDSMFFQCQQLSLTIDSSFFEGAPAITTGVALFYGSGITVDLSEAGCFLAPLTAITNSSFMFANCTGCTGTIQEGFFSSNTSLTSITGMFRNSGVSGLPATGSLFRAANDTETIYDITDIAGLFEGCSSLETTPNANLFAGASNVTNAGTEDVTLPGGSIVTVSGLFRGTAITRFSRYLFTGIPNVLDLSGCFAECTDLIGQSDVQSFTGDFLDTLTMLLDVSNMFNGCVNLAVQVPLLFSSAAKGKITSVSGMFKNTGISGFSSGLFTNMTRLTDVSSLFEGCTSLAFTLDQVNLLSGCTSIKDASSMFKGCENIIGDVPASLFDSCRSTIQKVDSLFEGCTGLDGIIETGNEDATTVTTYGLFANCTSLVSASRVFYGCKNLTGKIPWDIFWSESDYNKLEDISYMFYTCGFNTPVTYNELSLLFDPTMFSRLPVVTTISHLFAHDWNSHATREAFGSSYPIDPSSFSGQYRLTNIDGVFDYAEGLGGEVTASWFANSKTSIISAVYAFAYTNITNISSSFLRVDNDTPNVKLQDVTGMFYHCSSISGTGTLPPMYNPSIYTRIDRAGGRYIGFAYGCTGASNYTDFTGDWIANTAH